jgi:Mg/Co/Ni transporter MgtE
VDESARVQRDLAARLLAAQTGWVSSPPRRGADDATGDGSRPSTSGASRDALSGDAVSSFLDDSSSGAVFAEARSRGQWLLGLLVLQSSSSVVLQQYADLVRDNIVITLFLTMLVGAGGNAGNQSAIRVIRGLATGEMDATRQCAARVVWQQARVGALLASALALGGFLRVMLTDLSGDDAGAAESVAAAAASAAETTAGSSVTAAAAISLSLFAIVTTSTVAGTALPFALNWAGQDPANAGTTIQVCMDILGVVITCVVCSAVFSYGGVDGGGLVAALGGG